MKTAIILNPNAGRARHVPGTDAFRQALRAAGIETSIETTKQRGDAVRLARELTPHVDVLAIIGGDGTIHEAVNGMMGAAPDPVPLVVIPYGAGNDLASLLGCPRTPKELIDVLRAGYAARLDVLDFGDRFCINSAGLGFEGQVNRYSHSIRLVRGHLRYMAAVVKALASYSCLRFRLTTPQGDEIDGEKLLISIGNGIRTGGAFYFWPDAYPDDGLIDVCVVEPMGRLRMISLLPKVLKGRHVRRPEVTMLRVESLSIESDTAYPMHIDGEFVESPPGRREVTVRRRKVIVLCNSQYGNRLKHPLERVL
ncbi:MAG: diacylglycerol kinase family lipid kinase [Candidatus Latescibacterota bacterium]|nr:MAG: diacylglycerol kinase family lipid kinase [Candidatus Latescibacterota bacterium]